MSVPGCPIMKVLIPNNRTQGLSLRDLCLIAVVHVQIPTINNRLHFTCQSRILKYEREDVGKKGERQSPCIKSSQLSPAVSFNLSIPSFKLHFEKLVNSLIFLNSFHFFFSLMKQEAIKAFKYTSIFQTNGAPIRQFSSKAKF